MTDSQWLHIHEYVSRRLAAEESFEIQPDEFIKRFGLTPPFYQAMIGHAELTKASFKFHGHWKTSDGDPTDSIRFSRQS